MSAPDARALADARAALAAHCGARWGPHHLPNMARRHALRRHAAEQLAAGGLLDDPWEAQLLADLDTLFRLLGVDVPALGPAPDAAASDSCGDPGPDACPAVAAGRPGVGGADGPDAPGR